MVLVVLVMTRPRSPKTVFICIPYCVFGIEDFVGSSSWKVSLFQLFAKSPFLVFNFYKGFFCHPLSNKIGLTSFGLHLQKISHFRFANERFYLSPFVFYNILLNYDVSLHILIVLVVTIPTSPRLSKTEFVGESYCVYTIGLFLDRILKGKIKKAAWPGPGRDEAGSLGWPPSPPCAG